MSKLLFALISLVTLPTFAAESGSTFTEVRKSQPSPLNAAIELQYVPISYKRYVWTGNQTTDTGGHGGHLSFEWIPFDERYGKIGFGVGTGFYSIRNVDFNGTKATLTAIPIEGYVSYRFDYVPMQPLVPFLKAGVGHTLAIQKGIDVPGTRGFWSFDKAIGIEFNMGVLDSKTAKQWDRRSGVNNTYLVVEYSRNDGIGKLAGPDLTTEMFRVGLRFEM